MEYVNNQTEIRTDIPLNQISFPVSESLNSMDNGASATYAEIGTADMKEAHACAEQDDTQKNDLNAMQSAVQTSMLDEEEIDLGEYEIVRPEFFAHIKEPALTVNVDKIGVNAACVRLMPDVEQVQILVNRKDKKLLLLPCSDIELSGYKWGRTKNGKRYPSTRTGELFVLTICELMDWNPDYRYKVLGKMVRANGQAVIAFDLTSYECFPKTVNRDGKKVSSRQAIFAEQWSGKFGSTYSESRRSLQVDTLDDYTVFSIKGKKVEVKENNGKHGTQTEEAKPQSTAGGQL